MGQDLGKLVEPEEREGGQQRTFVRDTLRQAKRVSISVSFWKYKSKAHVFHDDVERTDPVSSDEQQLVRVCLVRQSVNVSNFALGHQLQVWHVGVFKSGHREKAIQCIEEDRSAIWISDIVSKFQMKGSQLVMARNSLKITDCLPRSRVEADGGSPEIPKKHRDLRYQSRNHLGPADRLTAPTNGHRLGSLNFAIK